MQVCKESPAYQPNMSFSYSPHQKQQDHSQAYQYSSSQQSQHPYNPYPDQRRCPSSLSQGPSYTLRDHTFTPKTSLESYSFKKNLSNDSLSTSPSSSSSSLPPSQEMFVTLEKLLMDISPFPPTVPNLAKPTCPSLSDYPMAELSSSSSSPSSISTLEPAEPYTMDQYYLKQEQPSEKKQLECLKEQYQNQYSPNCSTRSTSPVLSSYSQGSSSPAQVMDCGRDLSYWSPPTPNLSIDHHQSNHPSPLLPMQQRSKHSTSSWGYSLFDQMSLPLSISEHGDYATASTDSQSNQRQQLHQQYQSSQSKGYSFGASSGDAFLSNITRRAARTPPRQRISSELSGIRAYQSSAHHYTHHHHHYYNSNSNDNNSNNTQSATSSSSASGLISISNTRTTTNGNATSASSASVVGVVNQEGVKSYPCPTCNKAFPTRTQLKSHMAIHVDNFPFPCMYSGCDLHFKRKHDLRRHVDAKHALVKKYLCASGCGEGFGRRDQMIRHLRKGSCASFQSDHKM